MTLTPMKGLFPAIDIRKGQCVRLTEGDFDAQTVYGRDPIRMAQKWEAAGAKQLHIVDLDGAKTGQSLTQDLIISLAKSVTIPIQVGGGIRTMETAKTYLDAGIQRVILGTAAFTCPALLTSLLATYPNRVLVSLDVVDGQVALEGWLKQSEITLEMALLKLEEAGCKTVVLTDIRKDGRLGGPNLSLYEEVQSRTSMDIIASGGVTSLSDCRALVDLGLENAIVGKALYEGRLDLAQALEVFAC